MTRSPPIIPNLKPHLSHEMPVDIACVQAHKQSGASSLADWASHDHERSYDWYDHARRHVGQDYDDVQHSQSDA